MTHRGLDIRPTVASMAYNRLDDNIDGPDSSQEANQGQQTINPGTDEELRVTGYCSSSPKAFFCHLFAIMTIAIPYLVFHWRPDWRIYLMRKKCSLSQATDLIVENKDGKIAVVQVTSKEVERGFPEKYVISTILSNGHSNGLSNGATSSTSLCSPVLRCVRYFEYHHIRYFWLPDKQGFTQVCGHERDMKISSLLHDFKGYSVKEQLNWLELYGHNVITVEVKSYFVLLITEVINPFYVFQIASMILWASDNYVFYASCIFIISCISIVVSLLETRKQSQSLHDMVEDSNTRNVNIIRLTSENQPVVVEVNSKDIVPGDVVVLPATGCVMVCDVALISGTAIVNESMLTGESVPVTKTSIAESDHDAIYSPEKHKRHTIFCGTEVIQTRYYEHEQVLGVVVRTGFNTAKGELVRSILYPRPMDFRFYKDALKFTIFLFGIAVIGMSYSLYLYIIHGETVLKTIVRTLDIVTIVVPPALPAAMTVGTINAQSRLKKMNIFCISPPRINVCGKTKLFCFDKTGTLTEDGLEVWGAVPVIDGTISTPVIDISSMYYKKAMITAMASCHSLTFVHGKLIGDPLDLKMFEATNWAIDEPGEDTERFDSLIPTVVRPPAISSCTLGSCPPSSSSPSSAYAHAEGCRGDGDGDGRKSVEDKNVGDEADGTGFDGSLKSKIVPQTLEETPKNNTNYDILAPTIVRPCKREVYIDPPDISRVAESSLEMPYEIGIVRQFPFSSESQRMGVLVRVLGKQKMDLYVKGAPEVIMKLSSPDTLPPDLKMVLKQYTVKGFRVIAFAYKAVETNLSWHAAQRITRDQIESDLTFLGLLVLQNKLKPETSPIIEKLFKANIRTIMVTGDNILTAVCVARDCGMVSEDDNVFEVKATPPKDGKGASLVFEPLHMSSNTNEEEVDGLLRPTYIEMEDIPSNYHFAVVGSSWRVMKEHFIELIPRIVAKGTVFARMSPDQKTQLIEELQSMDYIVGMCGDGANDCGALKAAHVGISLSDAEASVAAPFTSKIANIECVLVVICEGRGALTTNFSLFKYMALYSIIQFISVLILYTVQSNLTDPQFLYVDLVIVTAVAILMGKTEANDTLVRARPLGSLLGGMNIFSVMSQIIFVIVVQVAAFVFLLKQKWYIPVKPSPPGEEAVVLCWETTTIFYISSFQYLALAFIYSPGKPFLKPIYSNVMLLVTLILLAGVSMLFVLYPFPWLAWLMQLKINPDDPYWNFRLILLLIAAIHFVFAWAVEHFIARSKALKRALQLLVCKNEPKNRYKKILNEMKEDTMWPPVHGEPILSCTPTC